MTLSNTFDSTIHETQWSGVPVSWADAPEPFVGALVFRVGRADEDLRSGGLTHLVEHLALSPFRRTRYDFNGRVEAAYTAFYASGSREEVLHHLVEVSRSIADLPLGRLPAERRILAAEASGAGDNLDARMMALRYGPVGYGLVNQVEIGLDWVTEEHVSDWARRWFSAGNAAVWLGGEPPGELEPLALPAGDRKVPPEPEATPTVRLPAFLADGTGGVALSFVTDRSTAIHAAFAIAIERAQERLRGGAGVSYAPGGSYHPLDGKRTHIVVNADCKDRDAAHVQEELLEIVGSLATDGPTEEELDWDRQLLERSFRDPHWALGALEARTRDLLARVETSDRAALLREREELTPSAVATALDDALDSLLVLVPTGTAKTRRRDLHDYEPDDTEKVDGQRHPTTGTWEQWGERSELYVGDDAFTYYDTAAKRALTWRYADCLVGIRLLSGAVTVIGRTGSWVTVYPDRYLAGDVALARIVRGLGDERLVPLSIRAQELLPVVRDQLDRHVGRVAPEVDFLPDILSATEEVRALAEARRRHQVGLLTITDRRLIFQFWGTVEKELFEKPLDAITSARAKGLVSKKLHVEHDGEVTEFEDVAPKERLEEIVRFLQG